MVDELIQQRGGKIVYTVVAGVLQHGERDALAGTRQPTDQDQLHLQEKTKDRASIAIARNLVILAGGPGRQSEHCPHAALNLADQAMF
jgi:hypothetical protein